MDYKKKYKEAIYLLKELRPKISDYYREKLDELFPELAESEDERIRKRIYNYINVTLDDNESAEKEKWLAWLEKQGKKQDEPKSFDCENANTQQKDLAPKVEPRFKAGDWVATNVVGLRSPLKIVDASDIEYRIEDVKGNSGVPKIDYLDMHYHLWTPDDAKDGDVMVTETEHKPFIFKGFLDVNHPFAPVAYCGIEKWNVFYTSSDPNWWTDDSFIPASPQEREQLFNAMHEKGYEWDADQKELKITDWSKHITSKINGPSITKEKPADNVESDLNIHPKFKVGDWVVIKDVIGDVQITEITDTQYGTVSQFGTQLFFDIKVLDREAHYAAK